LEQAILYQLLQNAKVLLSCPILQLLCAWFQKPAKKSPVYPQVDSVPIASPPVSQVKGSNLDPAVPKVSSLTDILNLPSLEDIVKMKTPTLKFVPKRVRSEWSRAWSETVQDCLHLNDVASYTYLFLLSKVCLRVPPSNLRARKAKEDFTLTLLKRWRGLVLTGDNNYW